MTVTGPGGAQVGADYPHGLRGARSHGATSTTSLLDAAIAAGAQFEPGVAARAPIVSAPGIASMAFASPCA